MRTRFATVSFRPGNRYEMLISFFKVIRIQCKMFPSLIISIPCWLILPILVFYRLLFYTVHKHKHKNMDTLPCCFANACSFLVLALMSPIETTCLCLCLGSCLCRSASQPFKPMFNALPSFELRLHVAETPLRKA